MRRFSIKAVVGCCALVVLLIGIWSPWNPSYQGVRLTAWIEELDHAYDTSFFAYTPYIPTQAVHALQCLSSSATPRFLRMLKQEDSAFLSQANGMLEKQPVIRWRFPGHDQDHARALLGFCALGESGAPAIPELTRLLDILPKGP